MKFKDNTISTQGIRPELVLALWVCDMVYSEFGKELVITSINDSKHKFSSLHYAGAAADLRTRYFDSETVKKVVSKIKSKLNIDYDVILENDHIHIEFQPKRRG